MWISAPAGAQTSPADPSSPPGSAPDDPNQRLERAEQAFQNADYDRLRPLLKPTVVPKSRFESDDDELRARTLLGVGLYFGAQQVTDAQRRQQLLDGAEHQFVTILRDAPDHSLNPLIYPASVVELFEAIKDEHAEELDKIRRRRDPSDGGQTGPGLESVYIERELDRRPYAGNFLPFGIGQFQNGEPLQGAVFAGSQAVALGLNVTGYVMIEALRDSHGAYEPGPGNAAEQARQWRVVQYASLGVFAGLYLWSVLDALDDYQPYDVRIRTLDKPPPELSAGPTDDNGATLQIGLGGVGVSW